MRKILIPLLFTPVMAYADFFSGNMLLERINSDAATQKSLALGYIMGVSDVYQNNVHCAGPLVTAGQTRDVVKQYLERNPASRDIAAELIIMVALGEAFPCKSNQKGNRS